MLEFFLLVTFVNALLFVVGEVRLRKLKKKHMPTFNSKSSLIDKVKGFMFYFLPILNLFGFCVLVLLVFCSDEMALDIMKKANPSK